MAAALFIFSACARQAETRPRAENRPALEFLGEWGTKGEEPGQLDSPVSLATDFAGSVYVTDQGNNFIHKFTALGHPLLSFQDPHVPSPRAVAVDSGGAIYVSDQKNNRIYIFLPTGDRLREQRRGGGFRFRGVTGLAVDSEGDLFVADAAANQVLWFDAKGRLRKAWGKLGARPGQFHSPQSIAVSLDGFVYIVDGENFRLQKFSRSGEFIAAWKAGEAGHDALKTPIAIAVNEKFAFVTDDSPPRVHVLTVDGVIVHTEDLSARVKLNHGSPSLTGIALTGTNELLVLDSAGARVLRYRINF